MSIPWAVHGQPNDSPWAAHEQLMGNPSAVQGQLVGNTRSKVDSPRTIRGQPIGNPRVNPRITHGKSTVSTWATHRRSMDSPDNTQEVSPWEVPRQPMGKLRAAYGHKKTQSTHEQSRAAHGHITDNPWANHAHTT